MEAVEALGYTPNFGARALAAKRTFTIGAVVPTLENAIFARGLQAFQEGLNERGYTLLVSSAGFDPDREAEQIKTLLARGADGLLLIGYDRNQKIYETLATRQVPYLLSWAHRASEPHPAVGFDNYQSMFELTQTVLENGHKKIAMISGIRRANDRAEDRVRGVLSAMTQAGLDASAVSIVEVPYSTENGADAFEGLMSKGPRPTAVICGNDVLAAGALQRARDLGIDVPGHVSITGFDDIEIADLVTPKLTTVHVPHREMGFLAAQELIDTIEDKSPARSHLLKSNLVIRQTLGPAGTAVTDN